MFTELPIIIDLLGKCRKEEIKTFRSYLKAFDTGKGVYRNKSLQLLELLFKNKNNSEEFLCKKIYGNAEEKNRQAFKRMVNRFKAKLYECLTLDVNVYRPGAYAELVQYSCEMRKLGLYIGILRGKVLDAEIIRSLNRSILIATTYELYNDLINLLYTKIEFLRYHINKRELEKIYGEIEYKIDTQKALHRASKVYQQLITDTMKRSSGYEGINDFKLAITELNNSYKKYQSANIKHIALTIEMEYAHKLFDYKKAESISYQQIELYKNSKAVYLKGRMGSTYLNLGNNLLYQYKFSAAIDNIKKSHPYLAVSNYINLYHAYELESVVQFYSGNLMKSEEILRQLLSLGSKAGTPFSFSRRSFFLASVLVLKKQHKEAHRLLQDTKEIEKDKEGWNLGIRILSIINQLEADKMDIADMGIESMRRHIDRTIKMKAIRKRDAIILKVLAALGRQGFNFKVVWKKHQKYFDLLSSNDPEYRWEIKSPEMIIFHKWFEAKAKGKDYDYVLKQE